MSANIKKHLRKAFLTVPKNVGEISTFSRQDVENLPTNISPAKRLSVVVQHSPTFIGLAMLAGRKFASSQTFCPRNEKL